jgi:threonylcarbamoyladenosine tRNA methylthiotransferase MtaB
MAWTAMKATLKSMGCKVNAYDTETIADGLRRRGFTITEESPDLIIINTCAVTKESSRQGAQLIRKLKRQNPNALIVVCGCLGEVSRTSLKESTGADLVVGTTDREDLFMFVDEVFETQETERVDVVVPASSRRRMNLKVQDGCHMGCSYCIIPRARPNLASMDLNEAVDAVHGYVQAGYKEVTLTGIHLTSYLDNSGYTLIDLIEAVSSRTNLPRLRLGSLEPMFVTPAFLERLSKVSILCPHFHLSLQSGSDRILKQMRRRYTVQKYLKNLDIIRSFYPSAVFTTDVIVGFPTETDEDFQQTLSILEHASFEHIHIFPYSPRENTDAALMQPQITQSVKKEREAALRDASETLGQKVRTSFLSQTVNVLYEHQNSAGFYEGYSENYLKVHTVSEVDLTGEIVATTLSSFGPEGILGSIQHVSLGSDS